MTQIIPFGKYQLLERVAAGGMAEIWKARDAGGRLVAVKKILPNIAADKGFVEMFIDEANVTKQLNHPHIARIFELGEFQGSHFISMEYIAGRDLRSIFDRVASERRAIPIEVGCYIMMRVAEGLDYAHNQRDESGKELELIHRDISPQNILISFEGDVKLIDFGLAKASTNDYKTQAGILKGKFGYMSPEQIMGATIDRRSDIFSAGTVLYEILTGIRAFDAESDFATLERVRDVRITPPRQVNPAIPEALEAIILKALAKDREERYQTALDLHDDLQSFMYGAGSIFQRKDLAAAMEALYASEIAAERARDAEYRGGAARGNPPFSTLDFSERASPLMSKKDPSKLPPPPPPAPPAPSASRPSLPGAPPQAPQARKSFPQTIVGLPAVGNEAKAAPPAPKAQPPAPKADAPGLDWDDEDEATAVFDRDKHQLPGLSLPQKSAELPPLRRSAIPSAPPPASKRTLGGMPSPFDDLPLPPASTPPSSGGQNEKETVRAAIPQAPEASAHQASTHQGSKREAAEARQPQSNQTQPAAAPIPPARRSGALAGGGVRYGLIAAGLLGIFAIGLVLYNLAGGTESATLRLSITPDAAEVWVDGEIYATSAPYIITGLDPRVPHILEVRAPGYRDYRVRVEVKDGQDLEWPAIELRPEEGAGADEGASDEAEAASNKVMVSFGSEPMGADVILIQGSTRRSLGPTPVEAEIDTSLGRAQVEMRHEGYQTWAGPLSIPSGRDAIAMSAALRREEPEPAAEASAPRPSAPMSLSTSTSMTATRMTTTSSPTSTAMTSSMTASTAARGEGTLTVNTRPASEVLLNGKSLGYTPIQNHKVPDGIHRLTFVNDALNVRRTISVSVAPGENVRRVLDLTQ